MFGSGLLRASLFRCRYLLLFLYRQAGVLNIMCVHMQTFIGFNLGFNLRVQCNIINGV